MATPRRRDLVPPSGHWTSHDGEREPDQDVPQADPLPVIRSVPVIRTSVTGGRCSEVQVSGVRGATVRLGLATVRLALAPRRFRASISKLAALMRCGIARR